MSPGASLGVLLPTRNSAALLPDHLAALAEWLDIAHEVIVVDSFSIDGTEEIIRRAIRHGNVRFISHPPGLYASWNAGLQQLTSQYAYISTIGETISRAGIELLLETARSMDVDVVLSKPQFERPNREPVTSEWPIDDVVRSLKIKVPRRLHRLEALVFACVHATRALTGSCASDVFRTAILQRFPFPTEYGTAGDGTWSVQHAAEVSWSIVPGSFSTFLLHSTATSQAENRQRPDAPRPDGLLRAAVGRWLSEGVVSEADLRQINWGELESAVTGYLDAKETFDRHRKGGGPWILKPGAWRARGRRERSLARLHAAKDAALGRLAQNYSVSQSLVTGEGV